MAKKIWVASANPVKIQAAASAFNTVFPDEDFTVEALPVSSGVPDQPVGVEQTLTGAINRVSNMKKENAEVDYFVGMEGGIRKWEDQTFAFAWMYIESKKGITGKAMTAYFQLPEAVQSLIEEGVELGHAIDKVFGKHNSKQKGGAVGMLTNGMINRTEYYIHAMILALIPFRNTEYFK